MTINIHPPNENQTDAIQSVTQLEVAVTAQVALSHAVAAHIAAAGVLAAQTMIATSATVTQMITTLVDGVAAATKAMETIAAGVKIAKDSPKNTPNKDTSYQMVYRSYLHSMLEEILAQLDELERTGYSNWEIIGLVIAKLNIYSAQLNDGVILPLQGLQGVDKAHSKLKAILEKMQAKTARGEPVTEEEVKEFAETVIELKKAIQELKDSLPQDDLGQPIYPNNQYKDLVERLEQNLNKILNQQMPDNNGGSIGDILENLTPENLAKLATAINDWSRDLRDHGNGPLKEWDEGKDGFVTLRVELQTMVSEFSDKLNRDAQMITSLNSMAQKQIELVAALIKTITANQLSR